MSDASKFTPPVQQRSSETFRRLIDAARDSLDTGSFESLTLTELTGRAGVTVGAFYHRFPSKTALLEYLQAEMYDDIRKSAAELFAGPPPAADHNVRDQLRTFVAGMAAIYQQHRGVLRELVQRSRSNEARQKDRVDMTREVVNSAVDWLLAHGGEIAHPEPRKALGVALLFTSSALRDVILFDEKWASGTDAGTDDLVTELTRAAEAYLGL